jgi:hypothetical protein
MKGTMWLFRRDPEELDEPGRERRHYGVTNLTHLFQRLPLDLEGYRLFGL